MSNHERRGSLTREQLRVWRNYVEISEALRARLSSRMQAESGLSPGDYAVLLALSESPEKSLRASELADAIGWERSRLSHHLARMEKRELVSRACCPDDSHGVDVSLTGDGQEAFRSGSVPHLKAVKELFVDALTANQLAEIDSITRSLQQNLGFEPTA